MKETRFTSTRRIGMKLCLLLFLIFSASISNAFAQATVTGVVTDGQKEPLPGVSVIVKGSTTGTVTDLDGNYSITAKSGDVLDFSYLGMKTQSIPVGSQTKINVTLVDDSKVLTETVVIGYGTAKAKDLTSPIAVVSAESLDKHLAASPMQAMQGQVSGVQITTTGQPGSSPKVNIRGIGTLEKEYQGPLYVVDGMLFDNIDFLSNNDIDNISILKDASSAAIYGVRAANGVVLVTTKKGVVNRKPQITYDGYVGFQTASNVLKMANSEQYTTFMKELNDPDVLNKINNSINLWGGANGVPSTSTDWYKEMLKTAFMQSHAVSITGGSKDISYSLGASYLNQDGVMNVPNGYERVNARARLDANATNWLKVGASFIMTNSNQQENGSNAWLGAYHNPSIYPVYDENQKSKLNPQGFASPQQIVLDTFFWNPMGIAYYGQDKYNVMTQVLPSFYAEGRFLEDKLTVRSAFSQDLKMLRYKEYIPEYAVGGNQIETSSYLQKRDEFVNNWVLDNTVSYRDNIGKHNFSAMLGNSIRRERFELLRIEGNDVPGAMQEYWYIHTTNKQLPQAFRGKEDTHWADLGTEYRGLSFFGRLMYDYDGKYLLSATMRADGSSKYQEKWGYFPSVGLGWVLTEENFMKDQHLFNFLKLRANWGKLGNDKVPANDGFASIVANQAVMDDQLIGGYSSVSYFSSLKWEIVEEVDLGFDFTMLNNRLSGNVDYFNRKTHDAVFRKPVGYGADPLLINGGEIQNKGLEIALNWNDEINKDFKYNAGVNMTFLNNKITNLKGLDMMPVTEQQQHFLGQPMGSFYGYKVAGVYQNQAEVDADPMTAGNNIKPGDFKYQDMDGDHQLTAADRVILGSYIPTFTLGGNLGFEYKNIDFNMSFQGQFNYQIYNAKRTARKYQYALNMDEAWYNGRWTGEGSTNTYPSALGSTKEWNIGKVNSFFVEDADYFTIQNIQLGYTFNNFIKSSTGSKLRLSLTAERPLNFFSYNGFTTNISDGIDTNVYPLVSSFSFGVKFIY